MSDDSEITGNNIQSLPTELLLKIFIPLPVKDLTNCRAVCVRWLEIIDDLAKSDDLWAKHCKKDFSKVYAVALRKAKPGLVWYNLYRSLTLWQKLSIAREQIEEFSAASSSNDEIRNFEILSNGVLGVHKKSSIVYYDIETLQQSKRGIILGDFARYAQNNEAIVALNFYHLCSLVRKEHKNTKHGGKSESTFNRVKLFTLAETALYYIDMEDKIYVCSFADKYLKAVFLKEVRSGVTSLGFSHGKLNILTNEGEIYTIVGTDFIHRCSLNQDNLIQQLDKYNLLEQFNWRNYSLNRVVPNTMQDITYIRAYGDFYFAGSYWGVLRIYYAPNSAGAWDIFCMEPVKTYHFMQRSDCPMCPILQVDVIEVVDGHAVLVAMPKKIVVLKLTHIFSTK